jgi:hypothetical protein
MTSGLFTYPVVRASGVYDPSVGSRSTTISGSSSIPFAAAFKNDFAAIGTYDITATIGTKTITLAAQTFADGGIYTIVLTGRVAKNNLALTMVKNK